MKKARNFFKRHKPAFIIVGVSVLILAITLPIMFICDAVGANGTGLRGEMSVWFDLLVGFLVTFGGFVLAMQFDDFFEKHSQSEQEADIWSEIENALREMRERLFTSKLTWLITQCDSLIKLCEVDSIAIRTTRKSPFYRKLYFFMTQLRSLPLENNEMLFSDIKELGVYYKDNKESTDMTVLERRNLIEAIFQWAIQLLLLDSVKFDNYAVFQDDEISNAVHLELKDKLGFNCVDKQGAKYLNAVKKAFLGGKITNDSGFISVINAVDGENNQEEVLGFCSFLRFSNDEEKKCKFCKRRLILKKIISSKTNRKLEYKTKKF